LNDLMLSAEADASRLIIEIGTQAISLHQTLVGTVTSGARQTSYIRLFDGDREVRAWRYKNRCFRVGFRAMSVDHDADSRGHGDPRPAVEGVNDVRPEVIDKQQHLDESCIRKVGSNSYAPLQRSIIFDNQRTVQIFVEVPLVCVALNDKTVFVCVIVFVDAVINDIHIEDDQRSQIVPEVFVVP